MHQTPTSLTTSLELITRLWSCDPSSKLDNKELDLESYFAYHKKQCSLALHDGGRHISARTHYDILEIAADLEEGLSRETIRERLSLKLVGPKPSNENELLDSSIDLTARLVSMMDIGVLQYGFSGRRELVWNQGSLKEFVNGYFNVPVMLGQDVKLERTFNARNLCQIGGISIVLTDNLADHLRMIDDEDKKVAIFHHASFLKCQQRYISILSAHVRTHQTNSISAVFPPGLIEETLRTLSLLFPQSDKGTAKWFRKQPYSLHIDSQVVKCGRLKADDRQIEKFKFWHDRLVILKQVFDESRPNTLSQWWCDRRNGVQWYTFWVAILVLSLTILFGMVQSIEGALQVYKAYYPT
ncbi:hypothetical protein BGZ57DRAFT_821832 [Hyaloscypha finlandica]|nr:hypothetical protein BGZ57DRAFT_821832 [Hyaloscypha finlandica]